MMPPDADDNWRQLAAHYPVIESLSPEEARALRHAVVWLEVESGHKVFDESQACAGFPLLISGSIRVAKGGESGREIVLYRVRSGGACVVSTACLLGSRNYCAYGISEGLTRLAVIGASAFQSLLENTKFRQFVFSLFADRVVSLMTMIESVAFQRLDQRLAARLLEEETEWRVSQQALADELGSVREIIGRLLKSFTDRGYVALSRNRVQLLDRAGLLRVARGEDP